MPNPFPILTINGYAVEQFITRIAGVSRAWRVDSWTVFEFTPIPGSLEGLQCTCGFGTGHCAHRDAVTIYDAPNQAPRAA